MSRIQVFKNGVAVANVVGLPKQIGGQPIYQEVCALGGSSQHQVGVTPIFYVAQVDRPVFVAPDEILHTVFEFRLGEKAFQIGTPSGSSQNGFHFIKAPRLLA